MQRILWKGHNASDFTCIYCTAAGTIFVSTYVYELGFSYLSFSIFNEFYFHIEYVTKIKASASHNKIYNM